MRYIKDGVMYHIENLFPICRSITGEGIRTGLDYFKAYHNEYGSIKYKSGQKVFDWPIPLE